jgi:hypothetical protein
MIGKLNPPGPLLKNPWTARMGLTAPEVLLEEPSQETPRREPAKKSPIPQREILWVVSGSLLSLPTLVFAAMQPLQRTLTLPETFGLPLTWMLALAGTFGPLLTWIALIVSLVATLQKSVTWQTKAFLWTVTGFSLAAWMFIFQTPPSLPALY